MEKRRINALNEHSEICDEIKKIINQLAPEEDRFQVLKINDLCMLAIDKLIVFADESIVTRAMNTRYTNGWPKADAKANEDLSGVIGYRMGLEKAKQGIKNALQELFDEVVNYREKKLDEESE